ncbi:putative methylesterase 11, chloroplastic [Selaginella moellendorffii]|nr:putative methylesterase 11, chloroplastic [Selaginella moellendorffii]|eukprot:XP_002979499.2 putative methylesterase 11, chloroplastic [Selaginella moellendorffii]
MGNQLTCMANNKSVTDSQIKSTRSSSSKKAKSKARLEEELLQQQQALALALFHQQQKVGRAMSQRYNDTAAAAALHRKGGFARSSSARPRSLADPELPPHQFLERPDPSSIETTHFVLVHGGGYGAWCWYKSITDPNCVNSLSQYAKPLSDFLGSLPQGEKVILVGHDFGGACVSHAMEWYPSKISKAIFVAAAMPTNSQRAFDVFAVELMSPADLLLQAQIFTYANGESNAPTALAFDKSAVKELFFNRSPAKDVALASVSLRPIPFAPVLEKLVLTQDKYGTVRRFFVETPDDNALTSALQHRIVAGNPPERVFKVKGSDHSPFFSKPQSLHRALVEIAHS